MTAKNNIFEDLARVSTNLAAGLFESGKNVSDGLRSKTQSFARSADLITRDEFEVVKAMATRIRLENETLLKESAELKKQIQAITSSIDVIKGQVSKGTGSVSPENNEKLMSELKTFGENVESRIIEFGNTIKAQQEVIDKLNTNLEKPAAKPKKAETTTSNPGLFDNE